MWERGLKLVSTTNYTKNIMSLPMWERGLKRQQGGGTGQLALSLPMWERGLKLLQPVRFVEGDHVAPYVGAWIETPSPPQRYRHLRSLPMWERGLKHVTIWTMLRIFLSLPMWERGLKQ